MSPKTYSEISDVPRIGYIKAGENAVLEEYSGFLLAVGTAIGELYPHEHESLVQIQQRLEDAALYTGVSIRSWVDGERLLFFVYRSSLYGW